MTASKPASARPFTLPFGLLVGQTLSIYFRNLVPFTLLGALVLSPWIALLVLGPGIMDPESPAFRRHSPWVLIGFGFANTVLPWLLSLILTGALSYGVVQQMRGRSAGLGLVLSKGFQNIGRSFVTGLLVGLRVLLFGLPAAIPILGIATRNVPYVLGMVFAFALAIPALIEYLRLYVALPAAVAEEQGGFRAVQRSKELTFGSKWPIVGGRIVIGLLMFAFQFLLTFAVRMLTERSVTGLQVTTIVAQILSQCLGATMMAVCYFLLRRGRENVDPAALAAVFD